MNLPALSRLIVLAGVMLAGCAGLGPPRSIDVDRGRLEQALTTRFPFETRWLGVFDVTAGAPVLRLVPESDRVGLDISLTATDRVFGRTLRGSVAFDSGLRFEPGDASLRMVRVRVAHVALDGLPDAASAQNERLAALLTERLLEGLTLYTLTPAQQDRLNRAGVRPGEVRVTPKGLSVALDPVSP